MKITQIMTGLFCLLLAVPAMAGTGSDGNQFFEMVFGNPNQRKAVRDRNQSNNLNLESCEGYGGFMGAINSFFCHMEKDMAIKGVGSATKSFVGPQGSMTVRAEVTQSSPTVSGVVYTYEAKVWVCTATCGSTGSFNRAFYLAFSYDAASGVNKGYALMEPGKFDNQTGSAMEIVYDIGTSSTTQDVAIKAVFVNSGGTPFKIRAKGQKTSTSMKMNVVMYNGTYQNRVAIATTPGEASKYLNMYFENSAGSGASGHYSINAAGVASAPATANGFCASGAETGDTLSLTSASAANCSSLSFLSFDHYSTSASGTPSVEAFTSTGITGSWQGMASSPTSL